MFKTIRGFEAGYFFGPKKSVHRPEPDADTLMILAGPSGSGKSSILQAAYREGIPLFSADYDPGFRESCKDKSYREYYDRKMAMQEGSFFQTHHFASAVIASICVVTHGPLCSLAWY